MKNGFLGAIAPWLVTTSLALAQAPLPTSTGSASTPSPGAPTAVMEAVPAAPEGLPGELAAAPCVVPGPAEPAPCFWLLGEYLLWRITNAPLPSPALQVAVPLTGFPAALGTTTGTLVVTNQETFPTGSVFDLRSIGGMRYFGGLFLDTAADYSVEAGYFQLFRHTVASHLSMQVPVSQPLTVNTFNTVTQATNPTASTATLDGTLDAGGRAVQASRLWGAEANLRGRACWLFADRIDLFVGFRYLDLAEDLTLVTDSRLITDGSLQVATPSPTAGAAPVLIAVPFPQTLNGRSFDRVATRNQFYGAQVGFRLEYLFGRFFANGWGKVAAGTMHQSANVEGFVASSFSAVGNQPGSEVRIPGGLLSQALDVGLHQRDRMGLVSEVNFNAGMYFLPCLRGYVGYDFMYVQKVLRPGDQSAPAATNTSLSLLGNRLALNQAQLGFNFHESEIWVQGINFGLELVW